MRKLLILFFALAIGMTACDKDNITKMENNDVSFNITSIIPDGNRDEGILPECKDLPTDYALFVLDGDTVYSQVYTVNGQLYTKTFQTSTGVHLLTLFELWNDGGTPGLLEDDTLVMAAPMPGSEYQSYVQNKLDVEFLVDEFDKTEVEVDVMCFDEAVYTNFGYYWFHVNEYILHEFCWFGDFCIKNPEVYEGTLYDIDGVQVDEVAVFRIFVDGKEFSNIETYGDVNEVCALYADMIGKDTEHTLTIDLYVGEGEDGPLWETVYTETWFNEYPQDMTTFVVGHCTDADIELEPYIKVPTDPFTMSLTYPYAESYIGIELSGIDPGYDLENGMYAGWCADKAHSINGNGTYTVTAVYSLDEMPPGFHVTDDMAKLINYLFNRRSHWSLTPEQIQNIIWYITDGWGLTPEEQVVADNVDAYGLTYQIPPGGWAAIFLDTGENTQVLFVLIDP